MGAHRRKAYNPAPSPEDESMKRAFWCASLLYVYDKDITNYVHSRSLLLLDRMLSASLGRPCAIQDEEFVPHVFLSSTPWSLMILIVMMSTCRPNAMTNGGIILIRGSDLNNLPTSLLLSHTSYARSSFTKSYPSFCAPS
jgi:hypothetical protein